MEVMASIGCRSCLAFCSPPSLQMQVRAVPTRGSLCGRPSLRELVRPQVIRPVISRAVLANAAVAADAPPQAVAHLKGTRGSAHKLRRVLDQIRGRSYEEALMILEFMPYRACEPILQTLISAASNAKNNQGLSKTKLFISECYADQSSNLKRFRPRAKGRGFKILKPTSHITIKVQERQ
eukprot:jgi/Botrbrau1/22984/Bobra.0030s0050.1